MSSFLDYPFSAEELFDYANGYSDDPSEIKAARNFIKTHITGSNDPTILRKKRQMASKHGR